MSEQMGEVYRQSRTAQDKYIYFLLAAAGAAIAVAINQTQTATLKWSQITLAVAVASWAASFFCGCRYLNYVSSILYSNLALLRVGEGLDSSVGTHPEMIAAAQEGIRIAIEKNSSKTSTLGRLQLNFLILGAVFFLAWHVSEMWLRTAHIPPRLP